MSDPVTIHGTDRLVLAMAEREAMVHLGIAFKPRPVLQVRAVSCPFCGAGAEVLTAARTALPSAGTTVLRSEQDGDDRTTLVMLGCESLTVRSLLSVGRIARASAQAAGPVLRTRSAAWVLSGRFGTDQEAVSAAIVRLAAQEEGTLQPGQPGAGPGPPVDVVPASTRLNDAAVALGRSPDQAPIDTVRSSLRARFLFPHALGPETARLDAVYLEHRMAIVRAGLR